TVRFARGAAEDALDLLDRDIGRVRPSVCEVGGDPIAELSHRRSARSAEQLAKAGRLVGSEDQLLETSPPSSAPAALSQRGADEGLHVQVKRRRLVHGAGLVDVVTSTVHAGVSAVAPFRVEVSDA